MNGATENPIDTACGYGFTSEFVAMPDQVISGTVRLGTVAKLKYVLRDEAAERKAADEAVREMVNRVGGESAIESAHVDWRDSVGADPDNDDRSGAIVILNLKNSTREIRRAVLRDLLGFLGDHTNPFIREQLGVRVR